MNSKLLLFVITGLIVFSYSVNSVFADSDVGSQILTLDRAIYPVPFGNVNNFASSEKSSPDGRSLFPFHMTAVKGNGLDASTILEYGDLTTHIRIHDKRLDASSLETDAISRDTVDGVGPLKISVIRDDEKVVLAYAGGSTPNKTGLIDVGDNNPQDTRQMGPIYEIAPDSGLFQLDFVIRYTDGPSHSKCPETLMFTSLNDDVVSGSEESRFDSPSIEKEDYCIMNGDVLTVEYSHIDDFGDVEIITTSSTFELRNGVLESSKPVYMIGSDMVLKLIDPDLDLDNDVVETYSLDLIEWDSDAATLTMGEFGDHISLFDPEPIHFTESGDSTGIFQTVVEIPQSLNDDALERGEEIVLEYTDWSPAGAYYVGSEDEDIQLTIFTSNFGARVELDKKLYSWTDKVRITLSAPDHNFDADLIDEIGNNDQYPVSISTRHFDLTNYKLIETGNDTGIFTGEVTLVANINSNDIPTGTGPYDGLLPAGNDDGITISFEFSEDETVVGSALVWSNKEESPLKQQLAGTLPKDVVCNDNYSKVYKHDGSAACVKSSSMDRWLQRGYSTDASKSAISDADQFTLSDTQRIDT